MKICIILGTRPEIIKMSPVIRECEKRSLDYFILHTGQHYSHNMDKMFFEQLELPVPKYNLEIGGKASSTHGKETGKMIIGIEEILEKEKPDVVLVEGDTNTVLSGALAASKMGIKVGHVEAGLRSYARYMPEEINRILTDHCSDYLFPPTEKSKEILLGEGIPEEKITVTGNTIVDAVYQNIEIAKNKSNILSEVGIEEGKYFLVTLHRQENVDDKKRFEDILSGLEAVYNEYNLPVIYPIHPRARKMMDRFGLKTKNITLIDPVNFLDFLNLESNAKLVLTDSGGVQEETCILKVPCVTLRDNTERPETVNVGSNALAGTKKENIIKVTKTMINIKRDWENPFGSGNSSELMINKILE